MGRGASGINRRAGGGVSPITEPSNPIEDKNFDVSKQRPTNASFIENMNEAQLVREIARMERRVDSAERERDQAFNSASMRRFNEIGEMFPGGVGGAAVTPAYRRMVDRAMTQAQRGSEAMRRADNYTRQIDNLRRAYNDVKGSGLLVREAQTARAAVGGNLAGKWTRSNNAATDGTFGTLSGQVNGDFAISKVWGNYHVYRNGRDIGRFAKADEAKRLIEKYAGRR